jgi:uncharacterized protein
MGKLFFLIAAGLLVYWILRSYKRKLDARDQAPAPRGAEDMVKCVHCGVNLPRGEAVLSQGKFFCGDEHRRIHRG